MHEIQSPFCDTGTALILKGDSILSTTPLNQIKMVGYFAQGLKRKGLIQLPAGVVMAVSVGDVIARERVVVRAIERNEMIMELPSGVRRELKI